MAKITNGLWIGLIVLIALSGCKGLLGSGSHPKTGPYPALNGSQTTTYLPPVEATDSSTLSPAELADRYQLQNHPETIKIEDNGKTITYTINQRFFIVLDDVKYPVKALTCEPDWVMGYVSNGSFNGPDRYPIEYEATVLGQCNLRNGDFSVTIVVVNAPHY